MNEKDFLTEGRKLLKYNGGEASVQVPEGIAEIGEWAFSDDGNIREVILPEGVTRICHLAFEHCKRLERAILPQSLREIGHHAFFDCPALHDIRIPDGDITIGTGTFQGCTALADADGFLIRGGVLYQYFGNSECIRIPSGVRVIGNGAFAHTKIKSVFLPDGITKIEAFAFMGCKELIEVRLPETLVSIGERAFISCGIRSLVIPKNVQNIGTEAFQYTNRLEYILILTKSIDIDNLLFSTFMKLYMLSEIDGTKILAQHNFFAVLGFTVAKERTLAAFSKETEKENCAYLRRYRKKFYPYFENQAELWQYMAKNKLIPVEEIPSLINEMQSVELRAALLSYQNENLTPKKRAKLAEKEERETEKLFGGFADGDKNI